MKISNIALIFSISCIFSSILAEQVVMIKNEYPFPIVLNINNQDAAILEANSGTERLYSWPTEIKIRTETGAYDRGIQKEVEKVWQVAQTSPDLYATITILNAPTVEYGFFKTGFNPSFKYNTEISQQSSPEQPSEWQRIFSDIKYREDTSSLIDMVINHNLLGERSALQTYYIQQAHYTGTNPNRAPMQSLISRIKNGVFRHGYNTPEKLQSQAPDIINEAYSQMFSSYKEGKVTFPNIQVDEQALSQLLGH